jgi:hypothetical protein
MSPRSFSLDARAFNAYVNWVVPAVTGVTPAADAILAEHRAQVLEVAAVLREMLAVEARRLYRGLLLDPEQTAGGILQPDPELEFLSWTEDRDVACWFADPESAVSGNIRESRPGIEGFLVEHLPDPAEILFHHTWGARFPLPGGRLGALSELAALHELVDAREFEWNLTTQKEVITLPLRAPVLLVDRGDCPDTRTLDARFAFPAA